MILNLFTGLARSQKRLGFWEFLLYKAIHLQEPGRIVYGVAHRYTNKYKKQQYGPGVNFFTVN